MKDSLSSAIKDRRTFYAIGKDAVVADDEIEKLISQAVQNAPSAFNSQGSRVVVLLGKEHDRLWEITKGIMKKIVRAEDYPATEAKLSSFQNGYGTILFYEDQPTVEGLQEKFPLYKDNFPVWSLESSGMLQFAVWLLLADAGFGVSLQHYNPLIDDDIRKSWGVPDTWKLLGEMPFGKPMSPPDAKTSIPLEQKIRFFK